MKKILTLTDFSENAKHAAFTASYLASRLHYHMILLNVGMTKPVFAGGPTVIDEIVFGQEEDHQKLEDLAFFIEQSFDDKSSDWIPSIEIEQHLGQFTNQVNAIVSQRSVELIVMGAREGNRLDHLLTGSETFSVIDSTNRPVLIVPDKSELMNIRKVIFATNFNEQDIRAIKYLIKLGDIFNFVLEIFHINQFGDDDITKHLREIEFKKHTRRLKYSAIHVKEVYGKNIIDRLHKVCKESKADILSFSHYHDSLLAGLFRQSATKKALAKQDIPLLIFPSKFVG